MNVEFTRLTEGFREWLHIVGYSEDTVKASHELLKILLLWKPIKSSK